MSYKYFRAIPFSDLNSKTAISKTIDYCTIKPLEAYGFGSNIFRAGLENSFSKLQNSVSVSISVSMHL